MLAASDTSKLQVLVRTLLLSLLSSFLAYLYPWYCFPTILGFEKRIQSILLEAFIQGLVYTLTRYMQV